LLVGAQPIDQRPGRQPGNSPNHAADAEPELLIAPERKPINAEALIDPKTRPEERAAVLAAIKGRGFARYDARGRVHWIYCEEATDADVKLFAALEDLDDLHIGPPAAKGFEGYYGRPQVTDDGLAPLLNARKLRSLGLVDAKVTDKCLKLIGRLPEIKELTLASAGITGAGLAELDGMKHLETLVLVGSLVGDEGLKAIAQLTDIRSLAISSNRITGAGMASLAGMKHLETLNLFGSSVGDDGMRAIAEHGSLRRLWLSEKVTPKGFAELVRLTSLDELKLFQILDDDDLAPIGRMTNLVSLRCALIPATDEGLRHMKNMARLRSLDLCDSPKVTDAGMAYVGQMKELEHLSLNRQIGDAGIAQLGGLTNLKELSLRGAQVTDAGLAKLSGLARLRKLDLASTHVSARGLSKLRGMKNLESVFLGYGHNISDEDARQLREIGIPIY
jgi:Leucine-rich repeat (LRR) protein